MITGSHFTTAPAVTFNGIPATSYKIVNDTTITATAPPDPTAGTYDVLVTNPDGTNTPAMADTFTYTVPPAIADECGTLTQNATWTPASIYVLTCAVDVPVGVTLTIAPGTMVKV